MKNTDTRYCASENGVRIWEIARQLGISPETMSRRLRKELSLEEKRRVKNAILQAKANKAN